MSEQFDQQLKGLIRPLTRFFMRNGLPYQKFHNLLKEAFIEAAEQELIQHGEKVNISKISVLSGITRKEVTRIYRESGDLKRSEDSLLARVSARWEQDKRFATTRNKPRILTFEGDNNEFNQLVTSVTKHVNAGTVLAEMQRAGLVEETARGLRLLEVVDYGGDEAQWRVDLAGEDIDLLLRAVDNNVREQPKTRNVHLRTFYDNISPNKLPQIRKWFQEQSRAFHRKMRQHLSKFDRDVTPQKPGSADAETRARVSITTFSLTEKFEDPDFNEQ